MSFFLTTAIDYVNSRPHLGTAYEKVTADVIARFKRLTGVETHFLMGNDEHSQNVFKRARELGEDPLAYCDRMETVFREVWGRLSISFDDFIRTTEPRHKAGVQKLVTACRANGDVYEDTVRRLLLCLLRSVQAGQGSDRRQVRRAPHAARVDSREEPLFPALAVSAVRCSSTTPRTRSSSSRRYAATRSCAWSKPASKTFPSAARDSPGAFHCPSMRTASSTCGSTR